MSKEKTMPDNNGLGQRPDTKTRGDIRAQQTDHVNPNSGPRQRSKKKNT